MLLKINESAIKSYRKIYNSIRRLCYSRLICKCPSIISRDCCGGQIYKNLGLKYSSPTVGLYFNNHDFIRFCMQLREYVDAELIEDVAIDCVYPVGKISIPNGSVRIFFMHYRTFADAKACWDVRKRRIDYNNIFILLNAEAAVDCEIVEMFKEVPFKRKVLLSSGVDTVHKDCINLKCYEGGLNDSLLKYKSKWGVKRFLDEYDWAQIFEP